MANIKHVWCPEDLSYYEFACSQENQSKSSDILNSPSVSTPPVKVSRSFQNEAQKKIFISFSLKTLERVTALKDRIERYIGKDICWMHTADMKSGASIYTEITQAIDDAEIVLCMINQDFTNSSECEREVLHASSKKKYIIPVMLEEVDWKNLNSPTSSLMKLILAPLVCVNLYDQTMMEFEFQRLIAAIEEKLGLGEKVHENLQKPPSMVENVWKSALAEQGPIPSVDPNKVLWPAMAKALNSKFKAANGRGLSSDNLQYLAAKALRSPAADTDDFINLHLSWSSFNQEPMANRTFTFWQWFYAVMELTRKHFRGPWNDGSIMGFVSRQHAQELLITKPVGTFLLRFSDSEKGCISIAWVGENEIGKRLVLNLQPYTDEDLQLRTLADRIKDLGQLVYLYPDIPKHVAFHTYYSMLESSSAIGRSVDGYVPNSIAATIPMIPQQKQAKLPKMYSEDDRGNWEISDIASHGNKGLIIAWLSKDLRQTCIELLSIENKIIFNKIFSHEGSEHVDERFVASMDSDEKFVTGCGQEVQVILNSAVFETTSITCNLERGPVTCVCFSSSESTIYVGTGMTGSPHLLALGKDLKLRQMISLPSDKIYGVTDLVAFNDRLIVCFARGPLMPYGNVSMIDVKSNQMIAEYSTILGSHFCPKSVTFKEDTNTLLILWSCTIDSGNYRKLEYHITYLFLDGDKENCQALCILTESARKICATRDHKLAVADFKGDVTFTDMMDFFSYDNLMKSLSELLFSDACNRLCTYFGINKEQAVKLLVSRKPGKLLLGALEEKRILQRRDVTSLQKAFINLKMLAALHLVEGYLTNSRALVISAFEKFVAEFSTFLTSDLCKSMAEHFGMSASEKSEILMDNSPGLCLLSTLKAKNIITPADVRALDIPAFSHLKQAVAKINWYQRGITESGISSLGNQHELTLEEKAEMFTNYLHLSIQSWYESICPLPWKKASEWDLSDLFIACGLTVTNTKSQTVLKNLDTKCTVMYSDIFTHKELKDAPRIVVEGNPGSGKTMLASQIAYDWMKGKIKDINYAILLQLKYVEDMTIPKAITKLILPVESSLTEADVETILAGAGSSKVCLIFDGLEEYTGGGTNSDLAKSEVMKVMNREKFEECMVILTTRSEYLQDLPKCPMLKIKQFGKAERDKYLEKVFPGDTEKQRNVNVAIENNPLLLELCDVPLLFVMAVHNMERMSKLREDEMEKVTSFVRNIIETLCTNAGTETLLQDELEEGEKYTIDLNDSERDHINLQEVAFNGLCTGKQQLSWPMKFIQDRVSNVRSWIDSGILIVEEEVQTIKKGITEESDISPEQAAMTRAAAAVAAADNPSPLDKEDEGSLQRVDMDDLPSYQKDETGGSSNPDDDGVPLKEKQQPVGNVSEAAEVAKKAIIVLQARFLHKMIQEWFAGKHLANLLCNYNQDEVHQCLDFISPIELHYILRFACGFNAKVTPLILRYLEQYCHDLDEDKRGPVSDCFCLCFLEHSGDREDLKETVRNFCKEGITICEEDSRQLQKAKIFLLNFASEHKIPVLKVKLVDVCERLHNEGNVIRLYLNSGVFLTPLKEVHSLMIASWSPKLEDFDFVLLMKYLDDWLSLQEADFHFPVPPPNLGEVKDEILLTHKKVTWSIGQITYHLDESGAWLLKTVQGKGSSPVLARRTIEDEPMTVQSSQGASTATVRADTRIPSPESQDDGNRKNESGIPKKRRRMFHEDKETFTTYSNALEVRAAVSQIGATIHIENSGVELLIPPNSFYGDSSDNVIKMKILPHGLFNEPAKSFTENSSAMVELLPNNLRLRNPAMLTLPHCLVLKDCEKCKVRIFTSHHEKGGNPVWEEITASTRYKLTDSHCKIWLQRFCWVTYQIDDEEVEAKKLVLYTAGRRYKSGARRVTIDVGYYPNLVGENELFLEKSQNQLIGCKQSFIFRRTPKDDLCITFEKAEPQTWITSSSEERIQYSKIETSCEQSCFFTFSRQGGNAELPNCTFNACQGKTNSTLCIDMEHEALQLSSASNEQEQLHSHVFEDHNLNMDATTSVSNKNLGHHSLMHPRLESHPSYSNNPLVPYHQPNLLPSPSANQFSYQQTLMVSGVNDLSLSQYQAGIPFPSRSFLSLPGSHLSEEGLFPIGYELLNELELTLGASTSFGGNNWKLLAEKLRFKDKEILYLEGKDTPVIAVLREAFSRGYFNTIDDLIPIFEQMQRVDVVRILSKHKRDTDRILSEQKEDAMSIDID